LTDLERRCVLPFYVRMMGLNALSHVVPFDTLRNVARETTDDEVARLLASEWRPRVMGAWLACGRTRHLEAALLTSLETSRNADRAACGDRRLARPGCQGRARAGGLPAAGYRASTGLGRVYSQAYSNAWGSCPPASPSATRTAGQSMGMLTVAHRLAAAEPSALAEGNAQTARRQRERQRTGDLRPVVSSGHRLAGRTR
jgi:Family of unknown function (DUF6000)